MVRALDGGNGSRDRDGGGSFGTVKTGAGVARPVAPVATGVPTPIIRDNVNTPVYTSDAGNPGYSGGYVGGGAPMGAMGMAPVTDDYLGSDDVYQAALSRYNKNFDDLTADITRRQGDYDTQYKHDLGDLGYIAGVDGGANSWDFSNQQTAAGRGYQSLIQDFAARGLLHSGDYLSAQNDFTGQLGKQFDAMGRAKQQFGEGINQEKAQGQTTRDSGIGQARAEALARIQQLYGTV